MNIIQRTSATDRIDYEVAKKMIAQTPGLSSTAAQQAILTRSYLRSIIALPTAGAGTQFTFQLLANQNNAGVAQRLDEQRLNQQDAFYAFSIMFWIAKASSAADTGYKLGTYPNSVTFPTGAAGLYQLYNGKYIVNVNNSVIVPGGAMSQFLNVPPTQLTAATNSPIDEFSGELLSPLAPGVVVVGFNNSFVQVQLPNATGTLDANTLLICELEGCLAQNVALGAAQ